jgi:proteic killer suppression protein
MIKSFRCKKTQELFETGKSRYWISIKKNAERKLVQLHSAESLDDLRSPPGNQLKALSGDRQGEYSIRINKKWRICFVWTDEGPEQVEIIDYH